MKIHLKFQISNYKFSVLIVWHQLFDIALFRLGNVGNLFVPCFGTFRFSSFKMTCHLPLAHDFARFRYFKSFDSRLFGFLFHNFNCFSSFFVQSY